jgi:hypothetical protein
VKNKKFWNWARDADEDGGRVLYLDGTIAEETWFDDEVSPAMFKSELMSGDGGHNGLAQLARRRLRGGKPNLLDADGLSGQRHRQSRRHRGFGGKRYRHGGDKGADGSDRAHDDP